MRTDRARRTSVPPLALRCLRLSCPVLFCLALSAGAQTASPNPATSANPPTPKPATGGAVDASNPDAQNLLNRAALAIQQDRFADAQSMLEGARAINSNQPRLWAGYGSLAMHQGDTAAAIADFGKELALHPNDLLTYRFLATAQVAAKQQQAAQATLRTWAAADPSNPTPIAMQVGLLLDDGKPGEAATAGETGLTHLPAGAGNDPQLAYVLGVAEIKAGNPGRGAALLVPLVQSTQDLALKNTVAYQLADASLALPVAETAQRQVVEEFALRSEAWTLDEALQSLRGGTTVLAAAWDTMGWILFREGKYPQAEDYVRAAWRNSQHLTVGEHLGEIEAARGDRRAALSDYQMALATVALGSPATQTAGAAAEIKQLQALIQAELDAGTKSDVADPHAALLRLRTLHLAGGGAHAGTATYKVLMAPEGVVRVLPAGVDTGALPEGAAALKRAKISGFFPPGALAQVVHAGTLTCKAQGCDFVMLP